MLQIKTCYKKRFETVHNYTAFEMKMFQQFYHNPMKWLQWTICSTYYKEPPEVILNLLSTTVSGGFHLYLFPFDFPFIDIPIYVVSSIIARKSVHFKKTVVRSSFFFKSLSFSIQHQLNQNKVS